MKSSGLFDAVRNDLRYAVRLTFKSPGFLAATVLALALAIGANSAIFSVVSAWILRPLAFRNPESLVFIWGVETRRPGTRVLSSWADFADWRARARSLDSFAALIASTGTLTGVGEPTRLSVVRATTNLFAVWGVEPRLGRGFFADEGAPGRDRVAVLSHGFWERELGSNPDAIGRTILLDGEPYAIVGVLGQDVERGNLGQFEVWVPLIPSAEELRARERRTVMATARLKAGARIEHAQAEIAAIARGLEHEHPATNRGWGARLVAGADSAMGRQARFVIAILAMVVFLVLLMACANVATLLLARATGRTREMAVRTALGATRAALVRQLLIESLVLAVLAGIAGLFLAGRALDLLVIMTRGINPFFNELAINRQVLAFTVGLSLLTPLIFGLWPAVAASKTDLRDGLNEGGGRTGPGIRGRRSRSGLVVSQLAVAMVLLIVTVLMIRSVIALRSIELGFDPTRLLTLRVDLSQKKYGDPGAQRLFYEQALERTAALPDVEAVAAISRLPLADREATASFMIEGRADSTGEHLWAAGASVTPGFTRALGVPLRAGRDIARRDEQGPPVALVNETMRRRYFAGEDPIGQRIRFGGASEEGAWLEIVGVVGDVRNSDADAPPLAQVYVPLAQEPERAMALLVRTRGDPLRLVGSVRQVVRSVDKDQPMYDVKSMEQVVFDDLADGNVIAGLLAAFGGIALALAATGLFAMLSYSVTQRTHEIGVRAALGAAPRTVTLMVVRDGLRLALIGVGIGLAGGAAAARMIAGVLYAVGPRDPLTFVVVPTVLCLVALLASWIPARRATKVDPLVALRSL